MSTGLKRTWRTGDTWRNVAYTYFRESGQWRYLLDLNSGFDVRFQPAPGVEIFASGPLALGKNVPASAGGVGLLKTTDTNLDLRRSQNPSVGNRPPGVFPWGSLEEYAERLGDYTAQGLVNIERTNGFALDSPQAGSESQRSL